MTISGCGFCRHTVGQTPGFCEAFPDGEGIPIEILNGEFNHRHAYPNDNDVRFGFRDGEPEGSIARRYVNELWLE